MSPTSRLQTKVTPADLKRLPVLHRILGLLNDPAASAVALGPLIGQLPVLEARVMTRYRSLSLREVTPTQALAAIGNRQFESILLELLEDLTILNADMEAAQERVDSRS